MAQTDQNPQDNTQEETSEEVNSNETSDIIENEEVVTTESTKQPESNLPEFRTGDTVKIYYKIIEGEKTRIQPYEGIVISTKGAGISKTFTVRRIGADDVGVERIFPLFSPNITKLEVKKHGKVRRSKLYYLRDKKGREATRIKERKMK